VLGDVPVAYMYQDVLYMGGLSSACCLFFFLSCNLLYIHPTNQISSTFAMTTEEVGGTSRCHRGGPGNQADTNDVACNREVEREPKPKPATIRGWWVQAVAHDHPLVVVPVEVHTGACNRQGYSTIELPFIEHAEFTTCHRAAIKRSRP
jgi:hypothetical protein